ncbi:18458_t:CDS:2 [Funneliformis geosporum]|nr:18458_t:CDS:2 [Funneliformis geosporum]
MSMYFVAQEVNNLSDGELRDYRLILGVEKENKSTSLWCVSSAPNATATPPSQSNTSGRDPSRKRNLK